MEARDIDGVRSLLHRYLSKFDIAPEFSRDEIGHWLLHDERVCTERVVWSYVAEDSSKHELTDFFSFYCLESSVIKSPTHQNVRAAYGFYYATQAAATGEDKGLKDRLNMLMMDALIIAKKVRKHKIAATGLIIPVQIRCLQCIDAAGQPPFP